MAGLRGLKRRLEISAYLGGSFGRGQSGLSPTDIVMTAMALTDTNAWAGKEIASFSASPVGMNTYTLLSDAGGKVSISKRGKLNLETNPVAGQSLNFTVRATPWGGGAPLDKAFTIPVMAFNIFAEAAEWWETDDLSKLKQDSAKTTPVAADGDPVGSWIGSKQGWEYQKAGTTNRPVYKTNVFGTKASVRAPGNASCFMDMVTPDLINFINGVKRKWSVIAVYKVNAEAAQTLFGWANGATARGYLAITAAANPEQAGNRPSDVGAGASIAVSDDTLATANGNATIYGNAPAGTIMIAAGARGEEAADVVLNGKTNLIKHVPNVSQATSTSGRLFQRPGPNNGWFNGDLYMKMLVPRDLSQYERIVAMRQIVAEKSLPVAIPNDPAEMDMSGYVLVYEERFDGGSDSVLDYLNADYNRDRIDQTKLVPGLLSPKSANGSTPATGGELGYHADPRAQSVFKDYPTMFIEDGKLVMRPRVTPTELLANTGSRPYLGAALNSKGICDLEPGAYFEVNVQYPPMTPGSRGNFCAPLWAMPSATLWIPSEIDAAEIFGANSGSITGTGAHINGSNRNVLSVNSHNNFIWPQAPAQDTNSDSSYQGAVSGPVPHDLTTDQHLIGYYLDSVGAWITLDKRPYAFLDLRPRALYGVTVDNPGDGSIPGTELTVFAHGDTLTKRAKLVFNVSGGVITSLKQIVAGGSKFPAGGAGVTWFRSDDVTPLGYGISLTAMVGEETRRANIYNGLFCFISNWAVGGSGIDGGAVDAAVLQDRPMKIQWFRGYEKVFPTPAIGAGEDANTTSLMNKWATVGYAPTSPQRNAVDNVIKHLKAYDFLREDIEPNSGRALNWNPATMASIWSRFAGIHVWHKIPVQAAQLVDWKNPGGAVLGMNGSVVLDPEFVQFPGVVGSYLEANHGLGSSAIIDPWDNHMGLWLHEGPTDTVWRHAMGGKTGTDGFFVRLGNSEVPINEVNTNYNLYNQPTISQGFKPISSGHIVWARNELPCTVTLNGRMITSGYQKSQETKPGKAGGSTMKYGTADATVQGAAFKARMAHYGAYITPRETKVIKDQFDGMWSYFG